MPDRPGVPIERRALLRGAALGATAAALGAPALARATSTSEPGPGPGTSEPGPAAPEGATVTAAPGPTDDDATVPFYGPHQAGITTVAQDRLAFAAFDLTTTDLDDVRTMLGLWSAAAARMTAGETVGSLETHPERPPIDTGEAVGLAPGRLTITVGFGPTFFDKLGLADRRPAALRPLPLFRNDVLDPMRSDGDVCVQACADDPQVAFHAMRNLARIGRGHVTMRWSQLGFGRTASTSVAQDTPRNLFGFKDGTNDIKAEHTADVDRFVWVGDDADQDWMVGGTYLVTRRIRMLIETWDNTSLAEQERVFGRVKSSGAPIGAGDEFDPVDLEAQDADGAPVIDPLAHIRLAAPANHGGAMMLRRGYSFTDGTDPQTGRLDAGLFFIAFVRDPATQFVPVQQALGRSDLLNEYIRHNGSALFAIPPGLAEVGDWYGKSFLA